MYLVPVTVKMKLKDDPPKAALAAMIADDRKQKYPILPKGLSVNTVKVKDGIATVDFSKELLNMDKSTTTEELFTAMTVNTLTEFPDIKEVKFLMNGKAITHLSGHSDMTRTFKRMNDIIKNNQLKTRILHKRRIPVLLKFQSQSYRCSLIRRAKSRFAAFAAMSCRLSYSFSLWQDLFPL